MRPILAELILVVTLASPLTAATDQIHPSSKSGHVPSAVQVQHKQATADTATHADEQTRLIERNAKGQPIRTVPNPEADVPLSGATSGMHGSRAPRPSMLSSIVQMIVSLAIVLGTAYLVLFGIRKYKNGQFSFTRPHATAGTAPDHILTMLQTLSLGPGRSLHIITVGSRCFLIAQTAQQITLLQELTGDESIREYLEQHQTSVSGNETGFLGALTRLLPQHPIPADEETSDTVSPEQPAKMTLAQFVKSRGQKGGRP